MGNLIQNKTFLFYDSLSADKFGAYTDGDGVKQFFIKEKGLSISENATFKAYGCTVAGTKKVVDLEIDPDCPCEECEQTFGITIASRPLLDGDALNYMPLRRYYSKYFNKIQSCSSGKLAASDITSIEEAIVEAVGNDTDEAVVKAYMKYTVDNDNPANASSVVITIDGTSTTISATGTANLVTAINGNSTVNSYVTAAQVGSTDVLTIIGSVNGLYFTVAAGTDTTVSKKEVRFESDTVYDNYDVLLPNTGFGTLTETTSYVSPKLTGTQLARLLAVRPDQFGSWVTQPDADTLYCMYKFEESKTTYNVTAASHTDGYKEEVIIIVPQTESMSTNYWDSANYMWESTDNDASFSADTSFYDMMSYVFGSDPSTW